MRVDLQPCYVLHTRAYKDTSLLVDVLSSDYGKLTLVARGARKPSKKAMTALQPFLPMQVSWLGKGSLKTLLSNEPLGPAPVLKGERLYSALYLNELLVYLLKEGELIDELYPLYHETLHELTLAERIEIPLRRFEFSLLMILGYGLDFMAEADTQLPVKPEKQYGYVANMGFVETHKLSADVKIITTGKHLLAIAQNQWSETETLKVAKHLARVALAPHLKHKPLKSRELFAKIVKK